MKNAFSGRIPFFLFYFCLFPISNSAMLAQDRLEARAKTFQSPNLSELKLKREFCLVELRKQKRTEQSCKRRALLSSLPTQLTSCPNRGFLPAELLAKYPDLRELVEDEAELVVKLCDLLQETGSMLRLVVETLRTYLASGNEKLLSISASERSISALVSFLGLEDQSLVFHSCWCLTNLTAGTPEITALVVKCGFLDYVGKLLRHERVEIVDQTIWTISNLIGEERDFRDEVIRRGIPEAVFSLLQTAIRPKIISNAIWLFSNICHGLPYPGLGTLHLALSSVPIALSHSHSLSLVLDSCSVLDKATASGDFSLIQAVLDLGVLPSVKSFLRHESSKVVLAAVKVVGNLLVGTDEQVDRVLDRDLLDAFERLLAGRKRYIRKEILWSLSNLTAGTFPQMQLLFHHSIYLQLQSAAHDSDLALRKEAVIAFAHATKHNDYSATTQMLSSGVLSLFLDSLESSDLELVSAALEGTRSLLLYCAGVRELGEKVSIMVEELGAVQRIEKLQGHKSQAIFAAASRLLDELQESHPSQDSPVPSSFHFS